jgi:transposase
MYKIKLSATEMAKLNKRRKKEKNKAISDRLQCIYLAAKSKENKEITKTLAINKNSATNWIKIYLEKGLDELFRPEDFDRRSAKIDGYIEKIKQDVKEKTITSLAELQSWIKEEYSLQIEQSWLWRCCKKNSIYLVKKRV